MSCNIYSFAELVEKFDSYSSNNANEFARELIGAVYPFRSDENKLKLEKFLSELCNITDLVTGNNIFHERQFSLKFFESYFIECRFKFLDYRNKNGNTYLHTHNYKFSDDIAYHIIVMKGSIDNSICNADNLSPFDIFHPKMEVTFADDLIGMGCWSILDLLGSYTEPSSKSNSNRWIPSKKFYKQFRLAEISPQSHPKHSC